jgi:hypothetical protein
VVIGAASLACYAYCVWRRATVHSEFVLLLGALLLSADLGYVEHQFHLLGSEWTAHFFVLAVIHGATAYYFDSATLLSLSIAALASWFGIERNIDTFFTSSVLTSMRAFTCAAVVGTWRFMNRRTQFERVFDHFIANLALWGGLILTFQRDTRPAGALLVVVMAVLVIVYGFRKRHEAFVIYAYIYGVVAVTIFVVDVIYDNHNDEFMFFFITLTMIAAIVGLFVVHARFRKVTE